MSHRSKSILVALITVSLLQLSCRRESANEFVAVSAPLVALTHVRVIDGTGAPAKEDQTILIESGRIKAIGNAAGISVPTGAKVLDMKGRTAIPGLVGMHEHLFDNLEHGLLVDTEFYRGKTPDTCAEQNVVLPELFETDIKGPEVQQLIKELVERRVAVTSTLAIFETFTGNQFQLDPRMQQVLMPHAYQACLLRMANDEKNTGWATWWQPLLKNEMAFEREFVRQGGILLAGVDPTGWGGVVAGFGDQRQLERSRETHQLSRRHSGLVMRLWLLPPPPRVLATNLVWEETRAVEPECCRNIRRPRTPYNVIRAAFRQNAATGVAAFAF